MNLTEMLHYIHCEDPRTGFNYSGIWILGHSIVWGFDDIFEWSIDLNDGFHIYLGAFTFAIVRSEL